MAGHKTFFAEITLELSMKYSMRLLTALAVLIYGAIAARADSIAIPETTSAVGSLDGTAFDGLVTLSFIGDTTNLTNPLAGIFVLPGTTTVSVSGGGTDTFTDQVDAVVNQGTKSAGFGDFSNDLAILFTVSGVFSTYDLTSSIGPVLGDDLSFNSMATFATTGGVFELDSPTSNPTFTAVESPVTPVPEPSSLFLLGTEIAVGTLVMGIRKKKIFLKSV